MSLSHSSCKELKHKLSPVIDAVVDKTRSRLNKSNRVGTLNMHILCTGVVKDRSRQKLVKRRSMNAGGFKMENYIQESAQRRPDFSFIFQPSHPFSFYFTP